MACYNAAQGILDNNQDGNRSLPHHIYVFLFYKNIFLDSLETYCVFEWLPCKSSLPPWKTIWIHRSLVASSQWIGSLLDRLSSMLHLLFRSRHGLFHSIKGLSPQKEESAVDHRNKKGLFNTR